MSETPSRISHYEILRPIGRGTMGVLYHARDTLRHREVALKVMTPEALQDDEARARFEHEAQLAQRVQHRNIVRVYEAGQDGEVPFIAMEFLRGQALADRMADGEPLALERKLDIVIQVCEGLQSLHEQDIVHRDVKPANIWLLEDGGVKLLDLGIARHGAVRLTQLGRVVGSAAYMAPEQLAGGAVDGRADVFSAAVVLFELLTGRKPFDADNVAAVVTKVLHEAPPDIRSLVPNLSPALAQSLATALSKNPANRYLEAADFASDLRLARDAQVMRGDDTEAAVPYAEPTLIAVPRPAVTAAALRGDGPDRRPSFDAVSDEPVPFEPTVVAGRPPVPAPPVDPDPVLRRADEVSVPAAAPLRPARAPGRSRAVLWAAAAAVVAGAVLAGLVLIPRSPAAPEYVLDVRSTPPGADIALDGIATGRRTPAVLRLPAPPARIGLALAGHQSIDEPLAPSAEQERTLEYRLGRLLQVHSDPPGARVVVDGRDTGQATPAAVVLGDPQPSAIELRLAGYEPGRAEVTRDALERGTISVTLARTAAETSAPGARAPQVTVNLTGLYRFSVTGCGVTSPPSTSHTIEVSAPCTLRLRAPEYFLDVMRSVAAPRGGRIDLTVPALVRVQLRSRHQDCALLVNGRAVGSPPVDLEMAAGSYTAALQCPDGQTLQSRAFEIEAGQSVRRIDDYLR